MNTEDRDNSLLELEEPSYLRRQKRIEVRRGILSRRAASLLKKLVFVGAVLAALSFVSYRSLTFSLQDPRFLLSEDRLQVGGLNHVARRQVAEKFAGDVGRSIFLVPLARRRTMLEEISWVETAAVARDWPNRLRVGVRERTPVERPGRLSCAQRAGWHWWTLLESSWSDQSAPPIRSLS